MACVYSFMVRRIVIFNYMAALLYGYTVAYGISGWSNVSPSEAVTVVPSAAVTSSKSAVGTAVIRVDLRSVKDR